MFFLLLISYQILAESSIVMTSVLRGIDIWKNNVFPSLFPFFVISQILINYGFVELISELLKPVMNKVFKVSSKGAFVFVLSLISGFPSSAKYIKELYEENELTEEDATKLLTFTHFSNPLFIIGTLSTLFLKNIHVSSLIIFCHYVSNILIGIAIRNIYPTKEPSSKISIKNAILNMHQKRINNSKKLGQIISETLINTINTLLVILGIITTFIIITTIVDHHLELNDFANSIVSSLLEITGGLKQISNLNTSLKMKCILSTMILSFGGISVHIQISSIIGDAKIKYVPFFIARIIHTLLSGLLVLILFDYWFISYELALTNVTIA